MAHVRRALTVLVSALLTVPLLSPPASAEAHGFKDRGGEAFGVDITRVRVAYAKRAVVTFRFTGRVELNQYWTVNFDTRRATRGPEYTMTFQPNTEIPRLYRVDGFREGFSDYEQTPVRCPGRRVVADINSQAPPQVKVPARCLGKPARIRVNTSVQVPLTDITWVDYAPGTDTESRRFTGWVRRG